MDFLRYHGAKRRSPCTQISRIKLPLPSPSPPLHGHLKVTAVLHQGLHLQAISQMQTPGFSADRPTPRGVGRGATSESSQTPPFQHPLLKITHSNRSAFVHGQNCKPKRWAGTYGLGTFKARECGHKPHKVITVHLRPGCCVLVIMWPCSWAWCGFQVEEKQVALFPECE